MKHLTPERRQKAKALIVKAVLKQFDPKSYLRDSFPSVLVNGDSIFTKEELELLWAYLEELEA